MNHLLVVSQVGLWVMVICLTLGFLVLTRQIALMHRRFGPASARMEPFGPRIGERAPDISAVDVHGQTVTLGVDRQRQTLLVFMSTDCSACLGLMPAVRSLWKSERKHLEIVLVSVSGTDSEAHGYLARHRLAGIPLVVSKSLAETYQVAMPPYAVLIGADQLVKAKGLVNHFEHLESLLNAAQIGHPSMESYLASTGQRALGVSTGAAAN